MRKSARISKQKLMYLKIWSMIFFFFFFHKKDFKWGKIWIWGAGLVSEKTEALYAELNKRAAAATSRYSQTGDFLQHIYSVLVAKN